MLLVRWLTNANPSLLGKYKEGRPSLPNPNDTRDDAVAVSWAAANEEAETTLSEPSQKLPRGEYHSYSDELRLEMAKSVEYIGVKATCRKFSAELHHDMPLS